MSIPSEWLHILSEERPLLSLEYLITKATLEDIYDALEIIEFRKYLRIEAENLTDDEQC